PQDQPDPAAEGSEVPVARDRRRAGHRHPGRDGARDPRRAARIRSGGHPLGFALVQPRAAGGLPARAECFPEQAPVDHPGGGAPPPPPPPRGGGGGKFSFFPLRGGGGGGGGGARPPLGGGRGREGGEEEVKNPSARPRFTT